MKHHLPLIVLISSLLTAISFAAAVPAQAQIDGFLRLLIEEERRRGQMKERERAIERLKEEWSRLPALERECLLQSVSSTPEALAEQGYGPNSVQPALRQRCTPPPGLTLATDIACEIVGKSGRVASRCEETYARVQQGGAPRAISQREALELLVSGNGRLLTKTAVETESARRAREAVEATADRLQILRGLKPKFERFSTSEDPEIRSIVSGFLRRIDGALQAGNASPEEARALLVALEKLPETEAERLKLKQDRLLAGERLFTSVGIGANEQQALGEAYYQATLRELSQLAGAQIGRELGQIFRLSYEQSFPEFKARYFTPDTQAACEPKGVRTKCTVKGSIRFLALQTYFLSVMPKQDFKFILSFAPHGDERARYLRDQIMANFVENRLQILAPEAEQAALDANSVDYSIAVQEIAFSTASYDTLSGTLSGGLTVRIRLFDVKRGLEVASAPTYVQDRIAAQSGDALEGNKLAERLSTEAASRIRQSIGARLVAYVAQFSNPDETNYKLVFNGIAQRDRGKIAALRQLISKVTGAHEVTVVPERTTDLTLELAFATPKSFDPEGLVDALYAEHKDAAGFDIWYSFDNTFVARLAPGKDAKALPKR